MSSFPVPPNFYNDWQPRLSSKEFYGEITDDEIRSMTYYHNEVKSVGDYLSRLLADWYARPSQSLYDPASKTWTLSVAGFSENYKDFIHHLTILRGVEKYKDLPGKDFILIYPYCWDEHPGEYANAYVIINEGNSQFVSKVSEKAIDEANQVLGKMLEDFSNSYED